MGIYSWDIGDGFGTAPVVRTSRLTIRCEYPDTDMPPTVVTFNSVRSGRAALFAFDLLDDLLHLLVLHTANRCRKHALRIIRGGLYSAHL